MGRKGIDKESEREVFILTQFYRQWAFKLEAKYNIESYRKEKRKAKQTAFIRELEKDMQRLEIRHKQLQEQIELSRTHENLFQPYEIRDIELNIAAIDKVRITWQAILLQAQLHHWTQKTETKSKRKVWKGTKSEFCHYVRDKAKPDQFKSEREAAFQLFDKFAFSDRKWSKEKCYRLLKWIPK